VLAWAFAVAAGAASAQPSPPPEVAREPKTCLVLSGGGARGFAHIGVLRWLEAQRVPIDCVVGTSMGAVVGGLYASGMSVDRIEATMRGTDWSELRGPDAPRPMRSPRRQEEDHEYTLPLEFRIQGGRAALPASVFGGARFEQQLRRWLGPRPTDESFDALPIPFRAVATRLGSGEVRVLDSGDLALAIRASMSVPGLFEPTRIAGGLYVDGGLVSNLPVDTARALGATRVIAVNVGTGLADESTLTSLVDVSVQTLAILTEQNVIAQVARLRPEDVLIAPPLDGLTFLDFPKVGAGIAAGTRGAEAQRDRLLALAMSEETWAARRAAPSAVAARAAPSGTAAGTPAGSAADAPAVTGAGVPLGVAGATSGTAGAPTAIWTGAATGTRDVSDTLRFGLSVGTDFTTGSARIAVGHRQQWASGIEWRNALEVGRIQRVATDLFVPVGPTGIVAAVPYAEVSRQTLPLYLGDRRVTEGLVERATIGLDAAFQLESVGELRLGPTIERARVGLGESGLFDFQNGVFLDTPPEVQSMIGLRLRYRRDTLDAAFLPRSGTRVVLEWTEGYATGVERSRYQFGALEAQWVGSRGPDTFEAYAQAGGYLRMGDVFPRWFTLGGFHRLSGYALDRFAGTDIVFGRVQWRRALGQPGPLGDRLWVGATLEAGRITGDLVRLGEDPQPTPVAGSLFVAAETPIGPLHLGLGLPRDGGPRMYLFLGRP
jgi:NTE family protein